MGSDNLFHKRKARKAEDLTRRKAKREPYAKVLIVCEGEKTEPFYFEGLISHYQLNSANIEVTGECGSVPINIVEHANQRYQQEDRAGDAFDKVYCVFDKDRHETYDAALENIARCSPPDTFVAINSVPCFEYWLILHFHYTTRPYENLPENSGANQLLGELLEVMPEYKKGHKDVFFQLFDSLEYAKANAKRALIEAHKCHTDNPSTCVQDLVEYLQTIMIQAK